MLILEHATRDLSTQWMRLLQGRCTSRRVVYPCPLPRGPSTLGHKVWDIRHVLQPGFPDRNPQKDNCSSIITCPSTIPLTPAYPSFTRVVLRRQRGKSSKFCPKPCKQPWNAPTSLSKENSEEKYFQDKNKLIDGGGFIAMNSLTLCRMRLTPFKIFRRCSKISSFVSSWVKPSEMDPWPQHTWSHNSPLPSRVEPGDRGS
jgi:hypothetical protein